MNISAALLLTHILQHLGCLVAKHQVWQLPAHTAAARVAKQGSESLTLTTRMVTPKEFLNGNFVDLAMAPTGDGEALGSNGVYALDASGLLLLMMPKNIMTLGKSLDGIVNLQVSGHG